MIWGMRKLRKAETREKGRVKDGRFFGGGGLFGEAHNRLSGSLYPFLDLGSAGRSVETWPGRGCLRKREKRGGKKSEKEETAFAPSNANVIRGAEPPQPERSDGDGGGKRKGEVDFCSLLFASSMPRMREDLVSGITVVS